MEDWLQDLDCAIVRAILVLKVETRRGAFNM